MQKLFLFIFPTLVVSVSAEIVNQILVKKSFSGFVNTTIVYLVFLIILFYVKKGFNKILKNAFYNTLVWYILLGIFGLFVEWNLLGNSQVQIHGQIAMFTFWASFGIMPTIFSESPMKTDLQKYFIQYLIVWTCLYLLAGILVNPGLGLLLWVVGSIGLNYFYIKYLLCLKKV